MEEKAMASILEKIRDQLAVRWIVLTRPNPLGWSECLATSLSRSPAQYAQRRLLCRHVADLNHPYFDIQGMRVQYFPPYTVKDRDYLLRGISQVITESFIFPNFFHGPVQIKSGDIVFDLGGNIGTTALLFSKMVGAKGRVFVFEPVMYQTLRDNLRENKIENVEVIAAAIGDRDDQIEIDVSDFCLDSSIAKREYTANYYHKAISVPLLRLDSFVAQQGLKRVNFVKMDIEGAEELALRGFKQGLCELRPQWSISSYHIDFKNEPQHPKLIKHLKQYGYNIAEKRTGHIYAW